MGYKRSAEDPDINPLSHNHYMYRRSLFVLLILCSHCGQELCGSKPHLATWPYEVARTRSKVLIRNYFLLLKAVKVTLIIQCHPQISCYKGVMVIGQPLQTVTHLLSWLQMRHPIPSHAVFLQAAAVVLRHVKKLNIHSKTLADRPDSKLYSEKATKPTSSLIHLTVNSHWPSGLHPNQISRVI